MFIPGTKIPIPEALKRKPVFGDREQIRAIYLVEHALEELEKDAGPEDGTLQQYDVTISFSGDASMKVSARSKKEAEEIAAETFTMNPRYVDDFEVDSVHATIIEEAYPL